MGNAWHLVSRVPATTYNGVPLATGQAVPLKEGDRLALGDVLLMYTQTPMAEEFAPQTVEPARVPTEQRARMQAFSAVGPASSQRFLRMRVEQGPSAGRSVRVGDVCLLGSGVQCQLGLQDPGVAEVHVEIRLHEGAYWCRAFGPCFKNELALTQDFQKTAPGERFRMGSTVIVFEEASE
jgi:predicted component of type VI protein secretion system